MPSFLFDENMDVNLKPWLETLGFSVLIPPKGLEDETVAARARQEQRTLVTIDRHFMNTDWFPPSKYAGIIVLAVHPPRFPNLKSALERLLAATPSREYRGKLFVVTRDDIEVSQ